MKICPKCKCPCPDVVEFCVCGHKFDKPLNMDIFGDMFRGISSDDLLNKKIDAFKKGLRS